MDRFVEGGLADAFAACQRPQASGAKAGMIALSFILWRTTIISFASSFATCIVPGGGLAKKWELRGTAKSKRGNPSSRWKARARYSEPSNVKKHLKSEDWAGRKELDRSALPKRVGSVYAKRPFGHPKAVWNILVDTPTKWLSPTIRILDINQKAKPILATRIIDREAQKQENEVWGQSGCFIRKVLHCITCFPSIGILPRGLSKDPALRHPGSFGQSTTIPLIHQQVGIPTSREESPSTRRSIIQRYLLLLWQRNHGQHSSEYQKRRGRKAVFFSVPNPILISWLRSG